MIARAILLAICITATGCETLPRDAFRMTESALAVREIQTREYESVSDAQILSASTAVLQDLGYAIDEIEEPLGVLSASKRADATNTLEFFGSVLIEGTKCFLTLFLDCDNRSTKEIGDVQDIRMTVVSRPQLDNENDVVVRVTIQRVIWDKKGEATLREAVTDSRVYETFFEKMSKAVFLEREGV